MASKRELCMVYGDMQADSADDQYPTIPLCRACIAADKPRRISDAEADRLGMSDADICEACDSQIVDQLGEFTDAPCEWCGDGCEEDDDVI